MTKANFNFLKLKKTIRSEAMKHPAALPEPTQQASMCTQLQGIFFVLGQTE